MDGSEHIKLNNNAELILAIDVGNTQTVMGLFVFGCLQYKARLKTDAAWTTAELKNWFALQLGGHYEEFTRIGRSIMSSVVPKANSAVSEAIRQLTGQLPLLLDRSKIDLPLAVEQPDQVGTDRLITAVAAKHRYALPVIVIDLGTATTISVVDAQGRFAGGTISPGIQTAAIALHQATAQLPALDMTAFARQSTKMPQNVPVIGTNTERCIQSGLIIGTAAMLEGLIDRIEEALAEPASRVITGGLAELVLPECRRVVHHEPDLLLYGLWDIARTFWTGAVT